MSVVTTSRVDGGTGRSGSVRHHLRSRRASAPGSRRRRRTVPTGRRARRSRRNGPRPRPRHDAVARRVAFARPTRSARQRRSARLGAGLRSGRRELRRPGRRAGRHGVAAARAGMDQLPAPRAPRGADRATGHPRLAGAAAAEAERLAGEAQSTPSFVFLIADATIDSACIVDGSPALGCTRQRRIARPHHRRPRRPPVLVRCARVSRAVSVVDRPRGRDEPAAASGQPVDHRTRRHHARAGDRLGVRHARRRHGVRDRRCDRRLRRSTARRRSTRTADRGRGSRISPGSR